MDNHNLIFPGKADQLSVEAVRRHTAYGIGRVAYHHEFGSPGNILRYLIQPGQEPVFRPQRILPHSRVAEQRPQLENGIAGIGHQHQVPGIAQGPGNVGHTLLGSVQGHYLILLQGHAEPSLIKADHGLRQLRQIFQGILVIIRIGGSFGYRLHHSSGGLEIRRPH